MSEQFVSFHSQKRSISKEQQQVPTIRMQKLGAGSGHKKFSQMNEEMQSRDLSRIYKEIYLADQAPIPRQLGSFIETEATQLITLFILIIQKDFQENENKSISKLIAYEPTKYIQQILGPHNLCKVIGLLELFGCQFMKQICGEHLKVRLPSQTKDANVDKSQKVRMFKTSHGKTQSTSQLPRNDGTLEVPKAAFDNYASGGPQNMNQNDIEKDSLTFLQQMRRGSSKNEIHYYQRLFRSILKAFAYEEGLQKHDSACIQRLVSPNNNSSRKLSWRSKFSLSKYHNTSSSGSQSPPRLNDLDKTASQRFIQLMRGTNDAAETAVTDRDTVQTLKAKLERAQELIGTLRKSYMKDINQMRNQMLLNEKYQHLNLQKNSTKYKSRENFYIDVQFFDSTTGFEPTVLEALNKKIEQMRYQFDKSIMQLQDYNIKLRDQIHTFKQLEKHGNVGISFFEMSADSVIDKLTVIEKDAETIWHAFGKHYHKGFFYNQIENEFGITPETHGKLVETFDQKLNEYKEKSEQQLEELSRKGEREIKRLKQVIQQKEEEILDERHKAQIEIIKQKAIIREASEIKLQNELMQMGKLHDTEKQEIFMEMRMLRKETSEVQQERAKHDAKVFLQKWLFLTAIRRIRQANGIERLKGELQNETEKFFEKERRRLLNINGQAISVMRDEVKQMREECNSYSEENNKLHYDNYQLKNTLAARDEQVEELQMENENFKNQLNSANKELDQFSSEYVQYKQNYEQSQQYVSCLETTNQQLKDKIEKLNKIAERFNQKQEIADTTLSYAFRGEQKAMNEFLNNTSSKSQAIYGNKNMQNQATLTVIFGLKKEIAAKVDQELQPMMSKQTQTVPKVTHQEVQVDVPYATMSRSQKSLSQERTPSAKSREDQNRRKSLGKVNAQLKKSSQSFQEYSVEEPSREYGKISEKDSLSELSKHSKELSKETAGNEEIVEIDLKKKKIVSDKHRKASRGYRLRLKNQEKQMREGDVLNMNSGKSWAQLDGQNLAGSKYRRNKSKEKTLNGTKTHASAKAEKSNLNVFNAKHMELILQKNLRLNKKTQEAATQTESSSLHELILSLENAKANSDRLNKPSKPLTEDRSLSQWLKKQLDKDLKVMGHSRLHNLSNKSGKSSHLNFNVGENSRSNLTNKKKLSTMSGRANQTTTRSSPSHKTLIQQTSHQVTMGGPYSNLELEKITSQASDRQIPNKFNYSVQKKSFDKLNRQLADNQQGRFNLAGDKNPSQVDSTSKQQLSQHQQSALNKSFTHFPSQLQVCLTGQKIDNLSGMKEQLGTKTSSTQMQSRVGVMAKVPAVLVAKELLRDQIDTSAKRIYQAGKRPVSGMMITMQNHPASNLDDLDLKEENSNMLLVSEGSADLHSAKYHSMSQAPDLKSKIQKQKFISINRNNSQLEQLGRKSFFKQRNNVNDESFESLIQAPSSNALQFESQLEQSPSQFDVAPWASQVQTTFSNAHLERPMSIRNHQVQNTQSVSKMQLKNRSISRPLTKYIRKQDQQAIQLKQFQLLSLEKNKASLTEDSYGQNPSHRMSRNMDQKLKMNSQFLNGHRAFQTADGAATMFTTTDKTGGNEKSLDQPRGLSSQSNKGKLTTLPQKDDQFNMGKIDMSIGLMAQEMQQTNKN